MRSHPQHHPVVIRPRWQMHYPLWGTGGGRGEGGAWFLWTITAAWHGKHGCQSLIRWEVSQEALWCKWSHVIRKFLHFLCLSLQSLTVSDQLGGGDVQMDVFRKNRETLPQQWMLPVGGWCWPPPCSGLAADTLQHQTGINHTPISSLRMARGAAFHKSHWYQ